MSFKFYFFEKIKKKKEFDNVFSNGSFFKNFFSYTVVYKRNNLGYPRLGIIVKKKFGCAVKRNYEKRIVREFFRKSNFLLPVDIIIILKNLSSSFDQKSDEFNLILKKIQDNGNY